MLTWRELLDDQEFLHRLFLFFCWKDGSMQRRAETSSYKCGYIAPMKIAFFKCATGVVITLPIVQYLLLGGG